MLNQGPLRSLIWQALLFSVYAQGAPHVELRHCVESPQQQGDRGVALLQSARVTVRKVAMPQAIDYGLLREPNAVHALTIPNRFNGSSSVNSSSRELPSQGERAEGRAQEKVLHPTVILSGERQPAPTASPETVVVIAPTPQQSLLFEVLRACVYIIFVCIVAVCYISMIGLQEPPAEALFTHGEGTQGDFYFGILQFDECCGRDQRLCVCAFCCLGIRWAETLSRDKLKLGIGFWSALLFCTGCEAFWWLGLPIVFVCGAVYTRQKLRATFGLEHGTPRTFALDCLAWCCCSPCAAVQEAREVEYFAVKADMS